MLSCVAASKVAANRLRFGKSTKFVSQHYEVHIDGSRRGAFEDVLDAISSARIAKQERPAALIAVADRSTDQIVIEIKS
jgi:hypothetical protein